ncbi:MAG: phosphatase PAP2 family protein [Acidimicrobiia bacterium]|nr:phosphatase PAP2 family protein [Acidimicrobiia bacterium]
MDEWLHGALTLRPGVAADAMSAITHMGTFFVCALLLVLALRHHRSALPVMLLGLLANRMLVSFLKGWFDRDRPPVVEHLVHVSAQAMPSGHAANAAYVAVAFVAFHPRWRHAAIVGALIVGLSRVMLGVHWPTDVMVGWVVGGLVCVVCALCASPEFRRSRRPLSPVATGS